LTSRELRLAAVLFAAALGTNALAGCGRVKEVLTSPDDGGSGAASSEGDLDGGTSMHGNDGTGGAGNHVTPGDPGMAGQGNLASGGYTSTRLDAGTGAMAAASAGGSAPPSAGGMAAVLDNLDPHAAERKNYIAQLCELTTKYSCVSPVLDVDFETGPTEQRLERCQQELDSIEYQSYGTQWDRPYGLLPLLGERLQPVLDELRLRPPVYANQAGAQRMRTEVLHRRDEQRKGGDVSVQSGRRPGMQRGVPGRSEERIERAMQRRGERRAELLLLRQRRLSG
jgi:hypothetical protein